MVNSGFKAETVYDKKEHAGYTIGRSLIEIGLGCLVVFGIVWWLVNGYLQLEISSGTLDLARSILNLCFGVLLVTCGVVSFVRPAGFYYCHITAGIASILYGIPGSILVAASNQLDNSVLQYAVYAFCGFFILLFTTLIWRVERKQDSREIIEDGQAVT